MANQFLKIIRKVLNITLLLWTYYVSVFLDVCHASFSAVDWNSGFQLQNASAVVDSNYYLFIKIVIIKCTVTDGEPFCTW